MDSVEEGDEEGGKLCTGTLEGLCRVGVGGDDSDEVCYGPAIARQVCHGGPKLVLGGGGGGAGRVDDGEGGYHLPCWTCSNGERQSTLVVVVVVVGGGGGFGGHGGLEILDVRRLREFRAPPGKDRVDAPVGGGYHVVE